MGVLIDLRLLLACLLLVPNIYSQLLFVTPPPPGNYSDNDDNPIYANGTNLTVQWASRGTEGLKDVDRLDLTYSTVDSNTPPSPGVPIKSNFSSALGEIVVAIDSNLVWGFDGGRYPLAFVLSRPGSEEVYCVSHNFNVSNPSEQSTSTETTKSTTVSKLPASTGTRTLLDGASSHPTSTASPTSSTATLKPELNPSEEHLSHKAVAGIAVGTTIGGLLLLGGMAFFVWKRGILEGVLTAGGDPKATAMPRTELPAMARSELPANKRTELPAEHWTDAAGAQTRHGGPYEMAS